MTFAPSPGQANRGVNTGNESGWVGHWTPGIGDPTPMGWATVAAYAAVAGLCAVAARRERASSDRRALPFWVGLAVLYVALGVNKQLDLQSLVTELGRINAQAFGWYERRAEVQVWFVGAVALSGVGALALLSLTAPWRSWARAIASLGTVSLLVFIVIRASSFHHVDRWLGDRVLGLRWNWLLELSGIALTSVGALGAIARSSGVDLEATKRD